MTPHPRPRVRQGFRRSLRHRLSVLPVKGSRAPSEASPRAAIAQSGLSGDLAVLLPRLWRFALRLAGDRRDAEDLVQRACGRALERRQPLQPGTSTLSWMFSIVHSVWLNELRPRQIRSHGNIQWSEKLVEAVAYSVACNPEVHSLHQQIIGSVGKLPDAQRSVMLLMAVEGLSYREAATVLDVPVGTVMSRLVRARLTIGESLGVPPLNRAPSDAHPS
jgi:RNA polymerase sigma-70 factor, ECF subfamily